MSKKEKNQVEEIEKMEAEQVDPDEIPTIEEPTEETVEPKRRNWKKIGLIAGGIAGGIGLLALAISGQRRTSDAAYFAMLANEDSEEEDEDDCEDDLDATESTDENSEE